MSASALVPLLVTLPLLGAAIALIAGRHRKTQVAVSVVTLTVVLAIAAVLLVVVDIGDAPIAVSVGNWPIPFGIVLYVDRLAALLVVVSSIVLLAVLLFSVGQGAADGDDDTPVSIFHPSYLILAAGIFTAFIAGDLFNLYVGFEILLVASYVLITLGSTESRIRTGVVYIVVSLVSSILFLAAIAVIYGALGTVNMVQISERMTQLPQQTQTVLHVLLLLAFSIKAAVFPLSFWLPDSYPTAPAPVTAVFAGLLTKVGVYAMIRTETQLFSENDVNFVLHDRRARDHDRRRARRGRAGGAQTHPLVHAREPRRLHGVRARDRDARGDRRDDLLHGPPHRGADDPVPRGRPHRAPSRQHVDPAGQGTDARRAGDRGAVLHPRDQPRRAAAVLGLHRQVRAVRRRRRGRARRS